MEADVVLRGSQGGGLAVYGTATLTNTNVYSNQALLYYSGNQAFDLDSTRGNVLTFCPYLNLSTSAPLTLELTGCCARAHDFWRRSR